MWNQDKYSSYETFCYPAKTEISFFYALRIENLKNNEAKQAHFTERKKMLFKATQ